MAYKIVVPRLGLTMEEGRIVEWFKTAGQPVTAGEMLFAVETDKVVLEVEAVVDGIVHPLPDLPNTPMPIGTLIGYILAPGEALPAAVAAAAPAAPAPAEAAAPAGATAPAGGTTVGGERKLSSPAARRRASELGVDWRAIERPGGGPILVAHVEAAAAAAEAEAPVATAIKASPLARRLAQEAGLDLAELAASKAGDKIVRADVEAAIAAQAAAPVSVPAPIPGPAPVSVPIDTPKPAPVLAGGEPGELIPLTQVRRVIAERMAAGAQTTAPVTLTSEADATELVAVRERFKSALTSREMVVPTYTDLLLKLTAITLLEHPMLNARWQEDGIFVPSNVHIAVAVDTEAGLLVPVVRDVPGKSLQQIAEESRVLADKARARKLGIDELQGGTFTITNLGTYGIDAFSPIINLPQCAILGVGRIVEKASVIDGQVVPRKMMALSLTFDHRVVDGGPAARFLNAVREYVEQPYMWLTR